MSSDNLLNISNIYILHCGINGRNGFVEKQGSLMHDSLHHTSLKSDDYMRQSQV